MRAIQRNETPSYYFLHYEIVPLNRPADTFSPTGGEGQDEGDWVVRNLLLVPHFAFPPSAIVKRPPLSATARRAGWVGCNFALNRIAPDARIEIVRTISSRVAHPPSGAVRHAPASNIPIRDEGVANHSRGGRAPHETLIVPPEEVREKFRRIKPLADLPVTQRGWTLDVLNIVRLLIDRRRRGDESLTEKRSQSLLTSSPTNEFTNSDIYAFERELAALHPDNRHIRDKIRQQLQVLRDTGFLV